MGDSVEGLAPPSPSPSRHPIVCEFCECRLTQAGEIIKRSPRARAFIDLDDDCTKLRARVADLESQLAAVRVELADAVAAAAKPSAEPATKKEAW